MRPTPVLEKVLGPAHIDELTGL